MTVAMFALSVTVGEIIITYKFPKCTGFENFLFKKEVNAKTILLKLAGGRTSLTCIGVQETTLLGPAVCSQIISRRRD